nr:MAG TPA: hypothetical protein [Caudoviricetes sp.]
MAQEAPVKFSTQKEKAHRGTRPGRLFRVWQIKNAPSSPQKRQGVLERVEPKRTTLLI